MGLFKSTNEINTEKLQEFLFEGEEIDSVYSHSVDFVALTNKRLIFVDQGIFSREIGVVTIPYSKIEKIAIVKDKHWTIKNEVEVTTKHDKHELKLYKAGLEFYNKLSKYICD